MRSQGCGPCSVAVSQVAGLAAVLVVLVLRACAGAQCLGAGAAQLCDAMCMNNMMCYVASD